MAAETLDNTTTKFELDGRTYEVPDFLDLDLDDWEIVWDEASISLTDFSSVDDEEKDEARLRRLSSPRVERAFIMVALRRARPDDDMDTIRADAGRIKLMPYLMGQAGVEENPTPASEPERSSKENSASSSESSSLDSQESSETPAEDPVPTGTIG